MAAAAKIMKSARVEEMLVSTTAINSIRGAKMI
jgi:hypothetical protein